MRLIVASFPGGGTDVFARLLAQALPGHDRAGQQFIVDNKPGASGNIGAQAVASAAPDGCTFLVPGNASIAINPCLIKKFPNEIPRSPGWQFEIG